MAPSCKQRTRGSSCTELALFGWVWGEPGVIITPTGGDKYSVVETTWDIWDESTTCFSSKTGTFEWSPWWTFCWSQRSTPITTAGSFAVPVMKRMPRSMAIGPPASLPNSWGKVFCWVRSCFNHVSIIAMSSLWLWFLVQFLRRSTQATQLDFVAQRLVGALRASSPTMGQGDCMWNEKGRKLWLIWRVNDCKWRDRSLCCAKPEQIINTSLQTSFEWES